MAPKKAKKANSHNTGKTGKIDFACWRHAILITPHQHNEVERSVGNAATA